MLFSRAILGAGAVLAALAGGLIAPGPASAAAADPTAAVPTPKLSWFGCSFAGLPAGQCDTVRLPLDYRQPHGATTEIALFRVPARTPKARIGTLFIGPDQAGGSALQTASVALSGGWLGATILDRFDIVAADPRGSGFSDNVACFATEREQLAALAGIPTDAPPTDAAGATALLSSGKKLGAACAGHGKALAAHMSTAETARDLEMLRRAVGDPKLSYLGSGYGSVIGQYYANMFPDRVRALVLDSVLDPNAWVGAGAAAGRPLYDRLGTADARRSALREVLARCGPAGPDRCKLAVGGGDPAAKYDTMIERIKRAPITLPPVDDQPAGTFSYRDWLFIANYAMTGGGGFSAAVLVDLAGDLYAASAPAAPVAARRDLARGYRSLRARAAAGQPVGFGYDNGIEAASAVVCTDGRFPADSARWPALIDALGKRVPDFAPYAWSSAQCAGDLWKARDTEAYTGPFNRRTSAPVLLTAARYGWAADYRGAVAVNRLLPGSGLLTDDGWGLTALGTSACVTAAVETYLRTVALPRPGTTCPADDQPYPSASR